MDAAEPGAAGIAVVPELAPIAVLCSGPVRYRDEDGKRYVHMVGLHVLVRGEQKELEALLCLNYPNGTYPTRLYFRVNLGLGLNWNENAYIFATQWFSWSWKDVKATQSPIEILAGHLEALR